MEGIDAPLSECGGVRIAIQGCGHGQLDNIYEHIQSAAQAKGWNDGVDLVIIGGDFQAVRNAADLTVMSCPPRYRKLGDFHDYYSGRKKAPYPTIYIGGNHEAASHHRELYYGGFVAPNIYYLGFANVVRFGPLRIAGMSGIWKAEEWYRQPHTERLPFNHVDIKSFYQVREFHVRKLLLIQEQVDICLSHDWPKGIETHGDEEALWKARPHFKQSRLNDTFGNPAASEVLDHLKPGYWFAAHMHCRFEAGVKHQSPPPPPPDEMGTNDEKTGQAPNRIFNTKTRFMGLSKSQPGYDVSEHLQLSYIKPVSNYITKLESDQQHVKYKLEYDPEWLAITRALHPYLVVGEDDHNRGDAKTPSPPTVNEKDLRLIIDESRAWVEENITSQGKLVIPESFVLTAPVHNPGEDPETSSKQPEEYTNPQTTRFCELLGLEDLWDASLQERKERRRGLRNVKKLKSSSEN
ncbi:Lariat debranching enzyme, C-terminal domain containing protein [Rhypophila decipiens]